MTLYTDVCTGGAAMRFHPQCSARPYVCQGTNCDKECAEHFLHNRTEQFEALKCEACSMFHHVLYDVVPQS